MGNIVDGQIIKVESITIPHLLTFKTSLLSYLRYGILFSNEIRVYWFFGIRQLQSCLHCHVLAFKKEGHVLA
jgi:uncharacterized protein with PQ loop repeat